MERDELARAIDPVHGAQIELAAGLRRAEKGSVRGLDERGLGGLAVRSPESVEGRELASGRNPEDRAPAAPLSATRARAVEAPVHGLDQGGTRISSIRSVEGVER